MTRVVAALAAVVLLAGCGFDKGTIEAGGRVNGPNLTIYSSLPQPGHGLSRDIVDAEKLAIAQAGGKAGDFGINFVSISEGPPDRDAPAKLVGTVTEQVIHDPQVIGVIGTLRSGTALTSVPLFNAAGILQVTLGAEYPGFDSPIAPGEPEHWFPSGRRTFARMVGNDLDQAPVLVRTGKRVAVEEGPSKLGPASSLREHRGEAGKQAFPCSSLRERRGQAGSARRLPLRSATRAGMPIPRVRTRSSTRGPTCARRSAAPSHSRASTRARRSCSRSS